MFSGTSRFQAVLLSMCCVSTTLTALLITMELGSPPAALPPKPRVTQIIS
uniref:Uncharacterized protein n=1 Tax=Anguilla anguilla TaxID=7936 RepID=A0A0E9XZR9_ANGAN